MAGEILVAVCIISVLFFTILFIINKFVDPYVAPPLPPPPNRYASWTLILSSMAIIMLLGFLAYKSKSVASPPRASSRPAVLLVNNNNL